MHQLQVIYCKKNVVPSIMCFLESPLSVSALGKDSNAYYLVSIEMIKANDVVYSFLLLYLLASPVDFCCDYKTWTPSEDTRLC